MTWLDDVIAWTVLRACRLSYVRLTMFYQLWSHNAEDSAKHQHQRITMATNKNIMATGGEGATVQELLKSGANFPISVNEAVSELVISGLQTLSNDLRFVKELVPIPNSDPAKNCGITFYSLEKMPQAFLLELETRNSNLFFERDFFDTLYDKLIATWKEEKQRKEEEEERKEEDEEITAAVADDGDNNNAVEGEEEKEEEKKRSEKVRSEKVILTGKAGIGKSFFQVSFLGRLLREKAPFFRFVVRQVENNFFLIDVVACLGYKITGDEYFVGNLLSNHGGILYLYEPAKFVNQPPLDVKAPSLSSLSPRPERIHEYIKKKPHVWYMPGWEYNELECIAVREKMDMSLLDENYRIFGGIARYTLEHSKGYSDKTKEEVIKRCAGVTPEMLRSLAASIDDNSEAEEPNNISGFVLSYTDIPRTGETCFESKRLTMTSDFVRETVMERMSFASPQEHLTQLARHLDKKSQDITGKDLEASFVYMLSLGQKTLNWECRLVGQGATGTVNLNYAKPKKWNREERYEKACLNYPRNKIFALVDCFIFIDGVVWAFQTTWQTDHAFKLSTLLGFRNYLELSPQDPLKLVFVNPVKATTYTNRAKKAYLAKGEKLDKPITKKEGGKVRILLDEKSVQTMWNNTAIYAASPKGLTWQQAIRKALEIES